MSDLSEFLDYFERTWIGLEHHCRRRRRPLFSIGLLNVRDRIECALPRTNNSVEGWHRAFDIRISITHPSISKLIRKIVAEQSDNGITLEKFRSGHELAKSKKKYIQLNRRIEKLVLSICLFLISSFYLGYHTISHTKLFILYFVTLFINE